jgi:hypothetical protein
MESHPRIRKEACMGRKARAALLSLAAASLVALMIDYLQSDLAGTA